MARWPGHPAIRVLGSDPDRGDDAFGDLVTGGPGDVAVEDGESQVGSGAVPVETFPSKVLAIQAPGFSSEDLARRLRLLTPPIFARIHKDAVLFDFRTIQPGEDAVVERALIGLLQ